jgi:hypothetical protein
MKKNRNLSLEPEAIARAEEYGRLHGTNVSQLVNGFLKTLPVESMDRKLTPAVTRLHGIAARRSDLKDYHKHLEKKYMR